VQKSPFQLAVGILSSNADAVICIRTQCSFDYAIQIHHRRMGSGASSYDPLNQTVFRQVPIDAVWSSVGRSDYSLGDLSIRKIKLLDVGSPVSIPLPLAPGTDSRITGDRVPPRYFDVPGHQPLYKLNWLSYVLAPFAPNVLDHEPLLQTQGVGQRYQLS